MDIKAAMAEAAEAVIDEILARPEHEWITKSDLAQELRYATPAKP